MKFAVLLFLLSCVTAASSQTPEAPVPTAPVPTAPAKPAFAVPPASYAPPASSLRPAAKDSDDICHAAPEGIYTHANQAVPEALRGAAWSYAEQIAHQVFGEWDHTMPRTARNVWQRGRILAVRLAIMPDGTHDEPTVTMSSGNPRYDNLALAAVRSHPSFAPPPEGIRHPLLVCLHFGYNMTVDKMDPSRYDEWQSQPKTAPKPQ